MIEISNSDNRNAEKLDNLYKMRIIDSEGNLIDNDMK